MALTIEYETLDDVTVGTTELSIVSGTTTLQTVTVDGVYQLWVDDRSLMTKTEEFAIRIYETVLAADASKRLAFKSTLKGVQSEVWVSPMMILGNGWDMTLQKIAGTDRAFSATIRQVA